MKNLEKVKLVNLTPHEVTVFIDSSNTLKIPPSGQVARVQSTEELVGYVNGISVYKTIYGEVQGLPEPQEDTIYIVSQVVLQALKEKGIKRDDVLAPNTGPSQNGAVRDQQGRIIGVRSFIVL
jgi:hypothetical protein